jgi:ubiquinone/menaquinone biosynthesis C-methylase UbiE
MILDVGCGSKPTGDVNVDFFKGGWNPQTGDQKRGEYVDTHNINNFVLADACHLPFKDESFNVAFSSHTIEHVQNPLLMLREMCRVAKRKVVVRCPHRKGSGAVMPYHINYFDEDWFKKASEKLGMNSRQFITAYDFLITERFKKRCPKSMLPILEKSLPYRAVRRFERAVASRRIFPIPFELEVWIKKKANLRSRKLVFVVVYNNPTTFKKCFCSSLYASKENMVAIHNEKNEGLPVIFNRVVKKYHSRDVWLVFCHQDFVLKEDLQPIMRCKDTEAVYGPIGARSGSTKLFGRVIQTNNTPIGDSLGDDAPVETLDEMCLIIHSSLFRQGLKFDERFRFHFYGADLCMQATTVGFDVLATQLNSQHKSRALSGNVGSAEYLEALRMFREKWKEALPIRTTTKLLI